MSIRTTQQVLLDPSLPVKENIEGDSPINVIFLNSHPIQYYAPMYKYMGQRKDINLTLLYCSKHGLSGELDKGFGVNITWDIPLLEGYKSVFLKNHSLNPNVYTMMGLINLGIIPFLFKTPKSILVVHGWGYITNMLALIFGRLAGHTVCIRGDNPVNLEYLLTRKAVRRRKFLFKNFIFRWVDYFLYVGKESKAFYQFYNVPEKKLVFSPHAVDNKRFSNEYEKMSPRKTELKKSLGLPVDKKVVLYSGKYIWEKQPMDLLKAFVQSDRQEEAALVFMGDGSLRREMEAYIREKNIKDVYLTGFVNQSKVSEYYTVADVFVMCSVSETWGLSVNEAMNFHLPLILSDRTSCSRDLLKDGENGFLFEAGNVDKLTKLLDHVLGLSDAQRAELGRASAERIKNYSYSHITESLKSLITSKTILQS